MNTDAIAALRTTDSRNRIAQGISYLLHPALMPLYTTLVFLWGNTLFRFMPLYLKGYVTGIVILTTLLAPMAFLLLLKATGIIRDYGLKSQADRIVPLLMTSVCYIACTLLLQKIMGSTLLYAFFIGITFIVVAATIVTYYWKISLHVTGIAGTTAMFYIVSLRGIGDLASWTALFLLLTGVLAAARLWLGKHDLRQVAAGFLLGGGIMSLWLFL